MSGKAHLAEETLHMLLDGELTGVEYAEAAAHLAACDACRAELAAMRALFLALDELAPAPNLVPAVRVRLAAGRPRPRLLRRWLAPALQAAAVVALLVWAATRPSSYWSHAAETLLRTVRSLWEGLSSWAAGLFVGPPGWAVELPGAVASWPGGVRAAAQGWAGSLLNWGPSLTLAQTVVLVALVVGAALVGNVVLLRRAALNGRVVR